MVICWRCQACQEPTRRQREEYTELPYFPTVLAKHMNLTFIELFQAVTNSYLRQIQAAEMQTEVFSRAHAGMTPICKTLLVDNPPMLAAPVEGSNPTGHMMTKMDKSANEMLKANHSPRGAGLGKKWRYQLHKETNVCVVLPLILWLGSGRSGFIKLSIGPLFTCLLLHITTLISTGNKLKMLRLQQSASASTAKPSLPAVPRRAHSTGHTAGTGAFKDGSSINEDNGLIPFTLYTTGNFPVQLQCCSRKQPGDTILQDKLHR